MPRRSGSIVIERGTSLQDCCVVVGELCQIGHGAMLRGCMIGRNILIGMGAIVLDDGIIEDDAVVGAASLVTARQRVPARMIVRGTPPRSSAKSRKRNWRTSTRSRCTTLASQGPVWARGGCARKSIGGASAPGARKRHLARSRRASRSSPRRLPRVSASPCLLGEGRPSPGEVAV
jgi:hypothetical protein